MRLLQRGALQPSPWPHLRVLWAAAILAFCVLLQILVLLVARGGLGKNVSVIASLVLGLILPAVTIVVKVSPVPRETLRLNGIPLRSACWVVGASLCFTLLIISSIELVLRTGRLPFEIEALLEEEERLLKEAFSFESARDLFTIALAVVVIAPIAEELLFRGLLQGSLERRLGNWAGLVIAGLAFGLLHGRLRFLPTSLLGILMGYTVMRTNSILSGILAHSCNNALALALAFSVESEFLPLSCLAGGMAVGGSGLMAFLWFFRRSTLTSTRVSKMARGSTTGHGVPYQGPGASAHNHGPTSGGEA